MTIPDHRAPGLPDVPHSSYCKACWYPVYSMWIDTDDHLGECPQGHSAAHECPEAMGRAKFSADLQKARGKP